MTTPLALETATDALRTARAALNDAKDQADAMAYLAEGALQSGPDYESAAYFRALLALAEKLHSNLEDSRPKWDADTRRNRRGAA